MLQDSISHFLFINLSEKIDTDWVTPLVARLIFTLEEGNPSVLNIREPPVIGLRLKDLSCSAGEVSLSRAIFIVGVSENTIHLVCVMTGASISCVILSSTARAHDAPPPSLLRRWWKPGWTSEEKKQVSAGGSHTALQLRDVTFLIIQPFKWARFKGLISIAGIFS